jgi:hypothetical protein
VGRRVEKPVGFKVEKPENTRHLADFRPTDGGSTQTGYDRKTVGTTDYRTDNYRNAETHAG